VKVVGRSMCEKNIRIDGNPVEVMRRNTGTLYIISSTFETIDTIIAMQPMRAIELHSFYDYRL
jgi:hypothetical protein